MRRRAFALVGVVLLWAAASAQVASADDELLRLPLDARDIPAPRTNWYGLYVGGAKVGWVREELGRAGAGDAAVVFTESATHLRTAAAGRVAEVDLTERLEYAATPPYALSKGRYVAAEGGTERVVDVVRAGAGWKGKIVEAGTTREIDLLAFDGTLEDVLTPERWFAAGRKVGDRAHIRSLHLSRLESGVTTHVVRVRHETVLSGVPTVWYEARMFTGIDDTEAAVRVDSAGIPLSFQFGGLIEARREPEGHAKDLAKATDLFVFGMAKVTGDIGPAPKVSRLVLDVEGEGAAHIPIAPRQAVSLDARSGKVTLRLGPGRGEDRALRDDVTAALAETVAYPIRVEAVVSLAKEAVGGAATPAEKVARLVRFVSEYVRNVEVPASVPVLQVIATKAGDCTEHTALFVTLARAAGIPAREVSGLMYMGDDVHAFGGHEWAEVALDGAWVPVDPTWDETELDAAHVTLARGGRGMGEVSAIGRLSFRVVEVERRK